ncbi:MAG: divalent metal cation transporter [Erythrobacter sp.]|uniref:NRAMP family divalent metal transporter n=1 Tax=Erythrobacter sp. TaxID=1042 RepID=UPI0032EDD9F1
MKRLGAILLWSAVAAAFIGPGTVTTAASAGASHGAALMWAVLFSALATFVLQEAAARLTIATGRDLGEVLRERFADGWQRALTLMLAGGAVVVGSVAYEAGNILGGVAGAALGIDWPEPALTALLGAMAATLLAAGSPARIARLLAGLVAMMGAGFLVTAFVLAPPLAGIAAGLAIPSIPQGAGLGVIALIGTTVVPYNLFLGSSLARGKDLAETRFGLAVAVGMGGLITLAIMIVGSALDGAFSFERLEALLTARLGAWAGAGLALGLFAAGLSSAVTAPLAAALTVRGLLADADDPRWSASGPRFRGVWGGVLGLGVAFGMAGIRPVPAIVLAQALNGLLLPVVAVFLMLAMRDRSRLGKAASGALGTGAMVAVTGIAVMLGAVSLAKVFGML